MNAPKDKEWIERLDNPELSKSEQFDLAMESDFNMNADHMMAYQETELEGLADEGPGNEGTMEMLFHNATECVTGDQTLFSKTCSVTGNVFELTVSNEQLNKWKTGTFIQDAFPELTAGQREFIKTGITPEEFDSMFSEDEK